MQSEPRLSRFPAAARFFPVVLVFLVAVNLVTPPAVWSADDADVPGAPHLLPQDTLAYIRIDSADNLRTDLGNSSMGRMLADPKLKPFASDVYQTMNDLFDMISTQVGISLEELLAIPSGQVSAAMMPGNVPEEQLEAIEEDEDDDSPEAIRRRIAQQRRRQNAIAGQFMINAGDNVDKLMVLVERLEQGLKESGYVRRTSKIKGIELVRLIPPRPGRPEVEYFQRDGTVLLGIGHQTASKALDHWLGQSEEPTLAESADFAAVMSRCVGAEATRPQMTFYVDPYHIVERVIRRAGGTTAFVVWPLIEELGLSKIRGVGGSAFRGGDDFDDITHFHVLIDPPRDGFFGVLRPKTGDSQPPIWVPADVTSYTSIHWNFEVTYDNLGKIIEKFQGAEAMQRWEDEVKREIGVEVRDQIVNNLTGHYVSCRWIQPPVKLNSQVQLHAVELTDPLKAKEVIASFRERQPNALRVDSIGGNVLYLARQPGNNENFPKGLRRPEPSFMLLDNWLIFSDSREFLERVSRANGKAMPRLLNVPEYELISSELGGKLDGEQPFLVSFLRSSDYIRQFYELAQSDDTRRFLRQAGEQNPVAQKIAEMLSRNELPPFDEFEKYFAPSGTFAYDEASGIHLGSFTLKAE